MRSAGSVRERAIAQRREEAGKVIDLAIEARGARHLRNAGAAAALVVAQRERGVTGMAGQTIGDHDCVLEGENAALREKREHGMGGIAQQRGAALRVALASAQGIERPLAPCLRLRQEIAQRGRKFRGARRDPPRGDRRAPLFGRVEIVEDGDDGDLVSGAHGVVHDVSAGREPEMHLGAVQAVGYGVDRHHGAHGAFAGEAQAARSEERRAQPGPQAVGGNQGVAAPRPVILSSRCDGAGVALGRADGGAKRNLDQGLGADAGDERGVEILAVRDPVWRAVTRGDPTAERQAGQLASRGRVEDAYRIGYRCGRAQEIGGAERGQDLGAVGSDLDSGAVLGESGAALEHVRGDAALSEGKGGCEAADAAARNQHKPVRPATCETHRRVGSVQLKRGGEG